MEMLGAILELGKTILAPISEYYKYHRSVDEHMKNLKRKRDDLECKKSDIESKMRAELLPRKKPKREVEFWLQKVKTINVEIQNTEQEAERGKYFSRMHVGKIACQKIQEVTELIDQSCGFGESLVIDPPVSYGDELPTRALVGERTAEITMEKIWKHLLDEDCGMIGVRGMGGVGKTTIMKQINNRLLKERDKFNHVIWVTVSKAFDVIKLQNEIASMLHPNPLKSEDETTRAGKLYAALKEMKKCVLILDDLWNAFPLENIGIPEPTSENGCKLVLTTRDAKVCDGMNCKTIKVELLSIKESHDLFLKTVGCDVSNIPEDVVEGVVKQCARLPLAIITIAGSLKNVVDVFEWRNTLNELRKSTKGSAHVDAPVFKSLQFSYVRLKDKKLQDCLLCCALYPEDYEIYRDELIEHLIGEKVIESMKSRQEELDQGHTLLNKLENACLLEGGSKYVEKRRFVKMHDLIRDMALQIAGAKFLVLEDVPNEEEWGNDVEKVSLMCKRGSKFPDVSPKCPKLSTLLLRGYVKIIPDSFFVHLHGLRVLHVDCLEFKSLPNSVSDLKHLTSLRLNNYDLKCVPSLAKLTALRSLDLSGGSLEEMPRDLQMLVNLRYLNVGSFITNQEKMPPGILPELCQLQVLKLPLFCLEVNGEEMVRLKKLESFEGAFDGVKGFNTYVESLEEGGPSHYTYVVNEKKPASQLGVAELGESVILSDCNICLLPKDVRALIICESIIYGMKVIFGESWKKSVWFKKGCEEIEYINSYFETFSLRSLEILDLFGLNNLKGLFREERVAPAPVVPLGTFSRLKQFSISVCRNIKKLFTPGLMQNLENIDVYNCTQLEEIIGGSEASDEVEEEEAKEIVKIFPRLRNLRLQYLPELKTICSSSNVILCDSLNYIEISGCPKLKRLPLSLHLIDGELSSPPSSLQIRIKKERWESLEWDNHDMKIVLEPFIEWSQ
ncbi:putative disease resistance protein At1g63350 [Quercus lobata]|uniref:AAA+ ATPase domain-containing protein n=1 Tax=Quercus lobata TaxID=97700 RepID=A0A7N2N404_QUELO|nr:putative disease resistance protein At1g63350 [Quercus lobata]